MHFIPIDLKVIVNAFWWYELLRPPLHMAEQGRVRYTS